MFSELSPRKVKQNDSFLLVKRNSLTEMGLKGLINLGLQIWGQKKPLYNLKYCLTWHLQRLLWCSNSCSQMIVSGVSNNWNWTKNLVQGFSVKNVDLITLEYFESSCWLHWNVCFWAEKIKMLNVMVSNPKYFYFFVLKTRFISKCF